jgi:hypothetical protein
MVTKEKFTGLTSIVIDNFEGGYYHPDMLKNFKPSDQAKLKKSGETMFGLDRMAGAQLKQFSEWKQFWSRVDAERAANPLVWKYNSRGGAAGPDLKNLAAAIMYQWFSLLVKKYITVGANEAIGNDDRLVIHHQDKEAIFREAIKARTEAVKKTSSGAVLPNVVIRQQGTNMMKLFKKMGLV